MYSRSPDSPLNDEESVRHLRELHSSLSPECYLAILDCFTLERPVRGTAEVAEELGMSPSTAHRYMIGLVALGYVERCANRRYRLSYVPQTRTEINVERPGGCDAA